MNATRRLFLSFALCLLATAVFAPRVAVAQSDDVTAQSLAKARETYERSMEPIRDDINKAITAKIARVSKPGKVDKDKQTQAEGESDAFKASGDWPDVTNATALKNRAATAGNAMRDAYAAARAAYTKANKDALRDAVRDEADQFEKQSDIIPWKLNLIENLSTEDRTLAPGGKPLTVEMSEKGEYRFEIRAKRSGEAGTLTVEVPLVDGKRLAIPALVGKDGNVRVLVTVREGFIGADLGVQRPVELSKAASGASTTMSLRTEGGAYSVESVRVKAVVQGVPEATQDVARTPKDRDKPKVAANPNDRLTVGTVLVGQRKTGDGKIRPEPGAKIESRIGNTIVLVTERLDGQGKLVRTIELGSKGRLSPSAMIARGGPLGNFNVTTGSGTFDGTFLTLTTKGKWSAPGTTNNAFEDTLTLRVK